MDAASCCRVSAARDSFRSTRTVLERGLTYLYLLLLLRPLLSLAGLLHAAVPLPAPQAGGAAVAAAVLHRVQRRPRRPVDLKAEVQGPHHGSEEGRGGLASPLSHRFCSAIAV